MKDKRAFLLLEVMVSIVIITGGLLFVMRVYSTAREALHRSRDLFRYSLLLEEKMFDFEEPGIIEEDKESGRFTDPKGYHWEVNAVSLAPEGQNLSDLCSVDLAVYPGNAPGTSDAPYKYHLLTYLWKKR